MTLQWSFQQVRDWFDNSHPASDFAIAFLAIPTWEMLRFTWGVLTTPRGRRKALKGQWKGEGTDVYVENGSAPLKFRLELKIRVHFRNVKAKGNLSGDSGAVEQLKLEGGFYKDRFLRLTYFNESKEQQGVLFLELDPNNEYLNGTYTGYSPRRKTIVAGIVRLTR